MELLKSQRQLKNSIIIALQSEITFIYLHGLSGAGKSVVVDTIAIEYASMDDWTVFLIRGRDPKVEPYCTIAGEGNINNKLRNNLNINFSINIPIFSFGIERNKERSIDGFNSQDYAFVTVLSNVKTSNILLIADEFQFWDDSSEQLVRSVVLFPNLLKINNKKLYTIIVENDDEKKVEKTNNFLMSQKPTSKEMTLSLVEKADLCEAITLLGYTPPVSQDDIDTVFSLTGGELNFIKIFFDYYNSAGSEYNLERINNSDSPYYLIKLLNKRLDQFGESKKDLESVLEIASIINDGFLEKEINYLSNNKHEDNIGELLAISTKASFLKKIPPFCFSNKTLKNLFYEKLNGKKTTFHERFYSYLKEKSPEKYSARCFHLQQCDDPSRIKEILSLHLLNFSRLYERNPGGIESVLIEKEIDAIISNSRENVIYYFGEDIKHCISAIKMYNEGRFKEAYELLENVISTSPLLFFAKMNRIKFLSSIHSNTDTHLFKEEADIIFELLSETKNEEKEIWCRLALTLFAIYADKLNDVEKARLIQKQIMAETDRNPGNALLEYSAKVLERKAAIFYPPELSVRCTDRCAEYFKEKNDILQYYMSLCNKSANLIVCGKYIEALIETENCENLISENPYFRFPSIEKVINNKIIAKYLFKERKLLGVENFDVNIAKCNVDNTITTLRENIKEISIESTAIMRLNLISLYLLKGDIEEAKSELAVLTNKILPNNEDLFYKYYISNIRLTIFINTEKWKAAEAEIEILERFFPPLFEKNKALFLQRHNILREIIKVQKHFKSPIELENWMYQQPERLNVSWKFFGRCFLFSDLQFLSQ